MDGTPARLGPAAVAARLRAAGCVFADDEARLLTATAATPQRLAAMVAERERGVPLEHVLGWAEFCGRRVAVAPGVFVPRRRSELLVRVAAAVAPADPVVVDLCCGAGAVAVALADALRPAELHAGDVDPAAVHCAARNLDPLGGRVHLGDLFGALPARLAGRVDVLVANAPYVPTGEIRLMPPEARLYEPRVALDGGVDGVAVHRRLGRGAVEWLAPGGHLVVETSARQAALSLAALTDSGLEARIERCTALDATVVVGARPRGARGGGPPAA